LTWYAAEAESTGAGEIWLDWALSGCNVKPDDTTRDRSTERWLGDRCRAAQGGQMSDIVKGLVHDIPGSDIRTPDMAS
jgi:hypothetical protein